MSFHILTRTLSLIQLRQSSHTLSREQHFGSEKTDRLSKKKEMDEKNSKIQLATQFKSDTFFLQK